MTSNNGNTAGDEDFGSIFDDENDNEGFLNSLEDAATGKEEETSQEVSPANKLTSAQAARAEKNRLKALALKKARLLAHPSRDSQEPAKKLKTQSQKKVVDTGGGFFIEEEDDDVGSQGGASGKCEGGDLPPLMPPDQPECEGCKKKFAESFMLRTFDEPVCDNCKDMGKDGEHELIAKTDAKNTFLIKDLDFEEGAHGPALKYLTRKNPHNPRGGEMKLFLRSQVEKRALEVWGSEEALQDELESREEKKVMAKSKKYEKKMKELRMAVRSSLYSKDISSHQHEYENEIYHEDKDEYSQTCKTCGHINYYEKM